MERTILGFQSIFIIHATIVSILILIGILTYLIIFKQKKNAEKKYREWNKLTQYIIEHSPSAIAVHDKDLNYLFVSKKYIETYRVN